MPAVPSGIRRLLPRASPPAVAPTLDVVLLRCVHVIFGGNSFAAAHLNGCPEFRRRGDVSSFGNGFHAAGSGIAADRLRNLEGRCDFGISRRNLVFCIRCILIIRTIIASLDHFKTNARPRLLGQSLLCV